MHVKLFNIITFLVLTGVILSVIPEAGASENSCIDCHKTLTPFIEIQMQFNQIRIQHLERGTSCSLECHEDRIRRLATANYQQWSESDHALNGITCDTCHGGNPKQAIKENAHENIKISTNPESPIYYFNIPKTCGNCHLQELDNFENSKHYQKLKEWRLAPTCTTCHPPHKFVVMNPEEFRNFCGNCHSITKKVAPYDAPVKAEYLLGKADKLKINIDLVYQDIFWAKNKGTDVTQADAYVDNAMKILQNLAPMWHAFNLTNFEDEVDSANQEIKKAQDIVKPVPTPTKTPVPGTPGFIGLVGVISLLAASYMIRKKN